MGKDGSNSPRPPEVGDSISFYDSLNPPEDGYAGPYDGEVTAVGEGGTIGCVITLSDGSSREEADVPDSRAHPEAGYLRYWEPSDSLAL